VQGSGIRVYGGFSRRTLPIKGTEPPRPSRLCLSLLSAGRLLWVGVTESGLEMLLVQGVWLRLRVEGWGFRL